MIDEPEPAGMATKNYLLRPPNFPLELSLRMHSVKQV